MNKQFKCIIFDLGYTLIHYKDCSWPEIQNKGLQNAHSYLQTQKLNLPPFTELIDRFAEIKERRRIEAAKILAGWKAADIVRELLESYKLPSTEKLIDGILECIHAPTRDLMYIRDNTIETLTTLKNAGLGLGIISNTIYPSKLHLADMELMEIASFFDFTIFSSDCPHRKLHPSIFETAIDKAGVSADKIIYVGDRYDTDVLGAQAVGIVPILQLGHRQKHPDPLPDDLITIDNLIDILAILNLA